MNEKNNDKKIKPPKTLINQHFRWSFITALTYDTVPPS